MSGSKCKIFLSSVQKELSEERRALKNYIEGDTLLSRYFDLFLFEDLPASDQRVDAVYLDEVTHCNVYLGLFGDQYGYSDIYRTYAPLTPTFMIQIPLTMGT